MLNTIAKHLNTYGGPEGTGFTFGPAAERFNFEAQAVGESSVILLTPPSPSVLKHRLKAEGGAAE